MIEGAELNAGVLMATWKTSFQTPHSMHEHEFMSMGVENMWLARMPCTSPTSSKFPSFATKVPSFTEQAMAEATANRCMFGLSYMQC